MWIFEGSYLEIECESVSLSQTVNLFSSTFGIFLLVYNITAKDSPDFSLLFIDDVAKKIIKTLYIERSTFYQIMSINLVIVINNAAVGFQIAYHSNL